mgnify:CR=1 FL=1
MTHKYYGSEAYDLPARIFVNLIAKAKEREEKDELKGVWKFQTIMSCITGGERLSFDEFVHKLIEASKPVNPDKIQNEFENIVEADRRNNNG